MPGLDDAERRVLEGIEGHLRRPPLADEGAALHRLICRGIVALGPLCARCGRHPDMLVTALGRDVQVWDRMAREDVLLS